MTGPVAHNLSENNQMGRHPHYRKLLINLCRCNFPHLSNIVRVESVEDDCFEG